MNEAKTEQVPKKRDEYEIREDYHAVKRFFEVHKDPERLKDVQEYIKSKQGSKVSLEAYGDGDLQKAIGL